MQRQNSFWPLKVLWTEARNQHFFRVQSSEFRVQTPNEVADPCEPSDLPFLCPQMMQFFPSTLPVLIHKSWHNVWSNYGMDNRPCMWEIGREPWHPCCLWLYLLGVHLPPFYCWTSVPIYIISPGQTPAGEFHPQQLYIYEKC